MPLGPREEGILLGRVQAGDPEAFGLLYHHFVGRVYGLARQILRERSAAEDATQETFLRVYRSVHRFRGESRLATWIHRIAANVCLSEAARRQRRKERLRPDGEDVEPQRPERLHATPSCELRLGLDELLERLSPGRRLVFYLCHVEGLCAAEVAEITGESVDAVHKKLQRARRQLLAAWLGDDTDDDLEGQKAPAHEESPEPAERPEGRGMP